jgi:predicted lactoylglutathione lyase
MSSNLIVSYPSADLEKSTTFYTGLGMTLNPALSGETAACFAYDDRLQFMLIDRETFAGFTDKEIGDPATTAMVQFSISRDSREEIDTLTEAGLAAGGTEAGEAQDLGFMYSRDLEDPDGNNLCFMWMAPEGSPEAHAADRAKA